MVLREAKESDSIGIAKVHVDTWLTTYRGIVSDKYLANQSYEKRERMWSSILSGTFSKKQFVYVIEDGNGQIVGFASCGLSSEENASFAGELICIYIIEEFQKIGLGKLLIRQVVQKLSELGLTSMILWVFENNLSARKFYEAIGGKKVKEELRQVGEDFLMEVAYGWENTSLIFDYI